MDWAFIGGTGFYEVGGETTPQVVATPYGEAAVFTVKVAQQEVAFLPRHGAGHGIPPHLVNYRANIWALRSLGVRRILATAAVGSLNPGLTPGSFVVLTQFLDFTKGRPSTFFQPGDEVVHTDMTDPYCPALRAALVACARPLGERLHPAGTYVCTEGPRFESAAEIAMYGRLGGDLVGMTGVPEVVLAREAGLCYASLAIVTNWAAGIGGRPLSHGEVVEMMGRQIADVRALFAEVIQPPPPACDCGGTSSA